jgi:membrane-associated phospholipid phosphatase
MIRIGRALLALACCVLCAAPARAQSVASLVTTLPADFGHLFTVSSAVILGIGGGASLAIHSVDDDIAARYESGAGARKNTFRAGHIIGGTAVQGTVALGAYIVGRASHHPRLGLFGADLVDAQVVNSVLTHSLKLAVNRARPNGSHYSFPSGHTSAAFTAAAVVQTHYGWKIAAPFYVLGAYVGVSRMVDRQHFASDVIFGAAIGTVAGRAASFGHGPHRVSVSPAALPGGVMVVGRLTR